MFLGNEILCIPCTRLVRLKFEMTNQDSAGVNIENEMTITGELWDFFIFCPSNLNIYRVSCFQKYLSMVLKGFSFFIIQESSRIAISFRTPSTGRRDVIYQRVLGDWQHGSIGHVDILLFLNH